MWAIYPLYPAAAFFFSSLSGAMTAFCLLYILQRSKSNEVYRTQETIRLLSDLSQALEDADKTAYQLELQIKYDDGYRRYAAIMQNNIHECIKKLELSEGFEGSREQLLLIQPDFKKSLTDELESLGELADKTANELSIAKNMETLKAMQRIIRFINVFNRKLLSAIFRLREELILMD